MVAAVDSMAFAGATPWHQIGHRVSADMSPREMCKIAGLEWQVETRPFPPMAGIKPTDEFRMLCRLPEDDPNGDAEILDVVGSKYEPVQNTEIFDYFVKFTKAGQMTMETAGSLKGGRFVWGLAKTGKGFTLPGRGNDEVQGYLLLMNPHKQGWALTAKFTPVRVVCWNTMSYALNARSLAGTGTFRHRHDQKFDAIAIATMEEVIGLSNTHMARYEEQATFLASRKATEDQVIVYLARLLLEQKTIDELDERMMMPKKFEDMFYLLETSQEVISPRSNFARVLTQVWKKDPGCKLESAEGTWWGAFNTFTYASDHFLGNGPETRAESSVMGTNLSRKQKALELALECAKAA